MLVDEYRKRKELEKRSDLQQDLIDARRRIVKRVLVEKFIQDNKDAKQN